MAETFNPTTGEVIETVSADGGRRYPAVTTLTDLVLMLEDGAFNQDSADEILEFSKEIEDRGCESETKVKGKITLTIEIERDRDGIYFFTGKLATKLPDSKRARTIGWVTPDNRFTPNKPNQGNLFGTIREIEQPARVIRD